MRHVSYNIRVVGTNLAERIKSEDQWRQYLGKVWSALGPTGVRNVQNEIQAVQWKNSTGRLQRAVNWESSDYAVVIYMDSAIAPHAIYQELGVRSHTMRYLLTASSPIPVPTGEDYRSDPSGRYPRVAFRWATERWMGVPHTFTDQRGRTRWATGWVHPGYEGKRFFRKGIKATLEEATTRLRGLVFEMSEDVSEAYGTED